MATSGTIGQTQFTTAKVLEKAIRRCGLNPATLTPEQVSTAIEDLFLLLLSLANRGINLWCVDKQIMPLVIGQATYDLPVGTLDVLNVLHSTPTLETGTDSFDATDYQIQLTQSTGIVRFGVKFSGTPPTTFNFQYSDDGVTWVTAQTVVGTLTANTLYWYDIDPAVSGVYFRIHSAAQTVSAFHLASSNREIAITPFNRDDYAQQPVKTQQSLIQTNYYFQKLVNPLISFWPVPSSETNHVVLFRHRQVQDIGTLTNEMELPSRWFEEICWQLAARLAFELPGVDPQRRQEVLQMSQAMLIEVEGGETDGSPIRLQPNIGVYNR